MGFRSNTAIPTRRQDMFRFTQSLARLTVAAGMAWLSLQAVAQPNAASDFPKQPIRMVVTFPPGGSADATVRMLTPRLTQRLGQQVVVDNRPGAGGNIGLTVVAKAPADGHVLGVGAAPGCAPGRSRQPWKTRSWSAPGCRQCPRWTTRTPAVPGVGARPAPARPGGSPAAP